MSVEEESGADDQPLAHAKQIILASKPRVAGRDYIEKQQLTIEKVSEWLKLQSTDDLDELAINSERVFIWRFGFDANPAKRRSLIQLKNDAELTDLEIRKVKQGGTLKFVGDQATLTSSWIMEGMGWGNLGLFLLLLAILLVGILGQREIPPALTLLKQASMGTLMLLVAVGYHRYSVEPSRIARRALKTLRIRDQQKSHQPINKKENS